MKLEPKPLPQLLQLLEDIVLTEWKCLVDFIGNSGANLSLFLGILLVAFGNSGALAGDEPRFFPPLDTPREQLLIKGWKFHRGDSPGAEAAAFDDSNWRTVNLPHDWSVEAEQEVKAIKSLSIIQGDCPRPEE